MKRLLLCILCLFLYACEKTNERQVIQTAKTETNKVLSDLDNKYGTSTTEKAKEPMLDAITKIMTAEQKLEYLIKEQEKMELNNYNMCQTRFEQEHINYPTVYKNKVCACFAKELVKFIYSKEYDEYKTTVRKIEKQENIFEECEKQNQKHKYF